MGRMLKALQQLEAKAPRPQAPPDPPLPAPKTGPQQPARGDATIEAALQRVEMAAAAVDRPRDKVPSEVDRPRDVGPAPSQVAPWPTLGPTGPHPQAYRELAENVLSQVPRGRAAALMFTSPSDGEGTTELLVSLAAALAERTRDGVLLLDGNLHNPDLARCLGVEATRGLAQVLMGAASWRQVLQKTSVPHLDLLPGAVFSTPAVRLPEHLNLRPLLDELRGQYRLVLIDTASLAHAEAASTTGYCDGTYLVVRLAQTTRRDLARAVEVIRDCRGHLLGSVVIGG